MAGTITRKEQNKLRAEALMAWSKGDPAREKAQKASIAEFKAREKAKRQEPHITVTTAKDGSITVKDHTNKAKAKAYVKGQRASGNVTFIHSASNAQKFNLDPRAEGHAQTAKVDKTGSDERKRDEQGRFA